MRIAEYNAQQTRIEPVEAGYAAVEREGRLIGQLSRQQSEAVAEGGRVQAQELRDETWPLEFDRFREAKGGGFRLVGGREPRGSNRAQLLPGGGREGDKFYYLGPHGTREASDGSPLLARAARLHTPKVQISDMYDPKQNAMLREQMASEADANKAYYQGEGPQSKLESYEAGGKLGQIGAVGQLEDLQGVTPGGDNSWFDTIKGWF